MNKLTGTDRRAESADGLRQSRRSGSRGRRSAAGAIVILLLAGAYSYAAPQLNRRFGWDLPQLNAGAADDRRVADRRLRTERTADANASNQATADRAGTPTADSDTRQVDRVGASNGQDRRSAGPPQSSPNGDGRSGTQQSEPDDELLYGILREVSRDRYISPAGLLYTPGSAEGHRLEHLRRHTKDAPGRPGKHGVFDGQMTGALKTVDQAYERAKKGQRTTVERDDGRTIYTVDMGKRVGYVGGREGNRRRKPMARRVRLVLEGSRVITAFPL